MKRPPFRPIAKNQFDGLEGYVGDWFPLQGFGPSTKAGILREIVGGVKIAHGLYQEDLHKYRKELPARLEHWEPHSKALREQAAQIENAVSILEGPLSRFPANLIFEGSLPVIGFVPKGQAPEAPVPSFAVLLPSPRPSLSEVEPIIGSLKTMARSLRELAERGDKGFGESALKGKKKRRWDSEGQARDTFLARLYNIFDSFFPASREMEKLLQQASPPRKTGKRGPVRSVRAEAFLAFVQWVFDRVKADLPDDKKIKEMLAARGMRLSVRPPKKLSPHLGSSTHP